MQVKGDALAHKPDVHPVPRVCSGRGRPPTRTEPRYPQTAVSLKTGLGLDHGRRAHVVVDVPDDGAGRSDEILAFGQIVCALTSRDDVTTVAFLREGKSLGVPRADGSLPDQPLVRADYAPLIASS